MSFGTAEHRATSAAIQVRHRIYGHPVPAVLSGNVLYSDQLYQRHAGQRRYFWLLDENVQLIYEPFGWKNEWYIDLVTISRQDTGGSTCFHVRDEYVDIVVEGMGPTYRVIDLDEIGDALASGETNITRLRSTLIETQRFLDRYLHVGGRFPPPQIAPFFAADHSYPFWARRPVRLHSTGGEGPSPG